MQISTCINDQDCSFLYSCSQKICVHNDVYPFTLYTIFVYLFTGVAAGLCNITGSSMGLFKMLILVLLLNYDINQATGLSQALVVGTAIPNFISIVTKKHPSLETSLVNYKLLTIIIPSSLLGANLGGLVQTFMPIIAQIIFLVLVFSFFIMMFAKKLQKLKLTQAKQENKSLISEEQFEVMAKNQEKQAIQQKKQQIINYEKSFHLIQILLTIVVFIGFEFISFLVQGKISFYSVQKCSFQFALGIIGLIIVTLLYLFAIKKYMNKKYCTYRLYEFQQQIYLDKNKQFVQISIGGFIAGFIQGILGMGCGTCVMMVLLFYPINSISASATSGYQILFTGLSSLFEYFINDEIKIVQSSLIIGICCVIGGLFTIILYKRLQKMKDSSKNKLIYIFILFICIMSIVLTIPTILNIINSEGWAGMIKIIFSCD